LNQSQKISQVPARFADEPLEWRIIAGRDGRTFENRMNDLAV
jgi:hypothetical protein